MTVIKQKAVTSTGTHQRHLRDYINNDRKVLMRDSLNMTECKDLKRWAEFMSKTRDRYGHNKAARVGRDGKPAKNTILYHQILGFNPDECDVNGGTMTPERCMRYAKDYIETYYPHQEVVLALHKEHCKEDGTDRYAVHMVINRTDLATGKRLDEGRSKSAKVKRASRIRALDGTWGLRQVVEGERNSSVHKRQPSKTEKEIVARGDVSYKAQLREQCQAAAEKARNIYDYRELLEAMGVDTTFKRGRLYVSDEHHSHFSFSVTKLDADLSNNSLNRKFAANKKDNPLDAKAIATLKAGYLDDIKRIYVEYRKNAKSFEGVTYRKFPKIRIPKPPVEIDSDMDVQKAVFSYWYGADSLRNKLASDVPSGRRPRGMQGGSTSASGGRITAPTGERSSSRDVNPQERGGRTKGR